METENKINWQGYVFLIAEDDDINYAFLEECLELSGVKIVWAKNGIEAIEMLQKEIKVDLILMDLKMPKKDGFTATKEIRMFNNNIPILAQTAFAFSEERQEAFKSGCNDLITKPIIKENLLLKINNLLKC